MVYGTIVEVFLQKLSQWYCDASPEAPSPEYTGSGDYRSSAPGGSAQGPSSHLTVAYHRRPDAVSCPKGVVFRHGTDSILHCRPQVSSQKKDTCCGVEGAVRFCRSSIRNSGFMPKDNRGVERIIKIFPHLLFDCES